MAGQPLYEVELRIDQQTLMVSLSWAGAIAMTFINVVPAQAILRVKRA